MEEENSGIKPHSETVKERLIRLLKAEKMSQAEFARLMGVSVAYVSAMRKALPAAKIVKLKEIFPELNRDWLLYGEGEMYVSDAGARKREDDDTNSVPLLPVSAYAGSLTNFSQSVELRDCERIGVPVKGAELAIPVTGESMEPDIPGGTIVAIRRINEQAFIPWGNPMVIDTENGVLIKVVYPSEKGEDYIEARSYNQKFPPIQIPVSSIFGLYRVVAYMRQVSAV